MKLEKKELWALLASVLLLLCATIVFFNFGSTKSNSKESTVTSSAQQISWSKLEKELAKVEKNPTDSAINAIDKELNKLPESDKKKKLRDQLDTIKIKLAEKKAEEKAIKSAETAVKKLEDEQNNANLTSAQDSVNKVKTKDKKDAFQARIDTVKAILEAQALNAQVQASQDYTETSDTSLYQSSDDASADNNYVPYYQPATPTAPSQAQSNQVTQPSSDTTPSSSSQVTPVTPAEDPNNNNNSGSSDTPAPAPDNNSNNEAPATNSNE